MITASGPNAVETQGPGSGPWLLLGWALVTALWWGFAFAPAGASTALAAAQAYCFGSSNDGLPAPWGWAVLILAPASLLSGILVAYGEESALALWRRRSAKALALVLLALLVAEGVWIAQKVRAARSQAEAFAKDPESGPLPAGYATLDRVIPAFQLSDQQGLVTGPEVFVGSPTVLTFVFSHCPIVCPLLFKDSLAALRAVPGAKAVFVTLDPWRDTPGALPGIAARFGLGAESRLLSGPPKQVEALLKALDMPMRRDLRDGNIDHPPLVYVVAPSGRIRYAFNRPSQRWLVEALRRAAAEGGG